MAIVVKESRRVSQSIEQFLSMAGPGKQTYSAFKLAEPLIETLTMLRMGGELSDQIKIKGNYSAADITYFGSPGPIQTGLLEPHRERPEGHARGRRAFDRFRPAEEERALHPDCRFRPGNDGRGEGPDV